MNNIFAVIFVVASLWFISPNQSCFAQSSFELEFIDDYPIKIDGGCSFFTYDTTALVKNKYVLIVSGWKSAFFKKDGKFVFLKHLNRKLKPNGYVDNFDGSGYKVTLDVNKTKKVTTGSTEVAGILTITQKANVTTIVVQGINEEYEINR